MGAPMAGDYRAGRARVGVGQYVSITPEGFGDLGFVLVRITQNNFIGIGMVTGRVVAFQGDNLADDHGIPRPHGAPFDVDWEIEFHVRDIVRVHDW